jgi:hypothetical protein
MRNRLSGGVIGLGIALVLVNGAAFAMSFLDNMQSGNRIGLANDVHDFWVGAVFLSAFVLLAILASVPSSVLVWFLKRRYPLATVLSGVSGTELRQSFREASEASAPAPLYLNFAMAAEDDGLSVWIGVFKPRILCRFDWSGVSDICLKDTREGLQTIRMLSLTIDHLQGNTTLAFPVGDERLLSVTRRRTASLEKLVLSLEAIRTHAIALS